MGTRSMTESKSLLQVLLAWRHFIIRATALAAVVAVVVSLLLPGWYASTATILPADDSGGGGGLLQLVSQLGSGGGTGRIARNILSRTPTADLAIGVLKSRRLRSGIVDRFDLKAAYDSPSREHAIRELGTHLEISTTPEGLVTVRVEDRDGTRAAEMANAFLELLDEFNREVSVENARRTRDFIGSRLDENRTRMDEAASRLRTFQETQGAIHLSDQTRVTVEAIASFQAERTSLDIERGVFENFAAPDQYELRQIAMRIREIDRALDDLLGRGAGVPDSTGAGAAGSPGVFLPLGHVPRLGVEFADLKREVLVQESVYEFLTSQYEEARIRVSQDQETITVLDAAVPPIRRARPRRSLIVILTCVAALFGFTGIALASESLIESTSASAESGAAGSVPELRWLASALARLRTWEARPHGVESTRE